jgi:hypothetical protein
MPSWFWILMWVVAVAVVAFLTIREIRAARRAPTTFDRYQHAAVREAQVNLEARGPNGFSQTWLG